MTRAVLTCCLAFGLPALAGAQSASDLVERRQLRKALPLVEAALKANPQDAEAAFLLSQIKLAQDDLAGALALAERAAAASPSSPRYRYQVAVVVVTQAQRANVFKQLGLARRFKREAEAALALDPRYVEALSGLAQFYYRAPGVAGGDKAKARELVPKVKAIDAGEGLALEARLALEDKDVARAGTLFRAAVQASAGSFPLRQALLGWLLRPDQQAWAEAETHAREALRLQPDRADVHGALAAAVAGQRRLGDLDGVLAAADAKFPDNRLPHYRAGNALLAVNADLPRAERHFRYYLAQPPEIGTPSHAAAHWRLGLVLEKQGRKADAVVALRQAVKLDPKLEGAKTDLKRLE